MKLQSPFRSTARTIAEDIVAERQERVELLSSAGEWKRVARDSTAAAAGVSGNMVRLAYARQLLTWQPHLIILDKLADGPDQRTTSPRAA